MFKSKVISIVVLCFFMIGYSAVQYGNLKVKKIVSVYDGDTFYADIDSCPDIFCKKIGVRIYGIDTPEMKTDNDDEKAKALVAKATLDSLLRLGKVEIHEIQRDKYFRVLGKVKVITKKGRVIAVDSVMIAKGLARPYFGGTKEEW